MVLEKLTIFRQAANKRCNIFIKLPADIDEKALGTVISLAYKYSIEGFIATGPTMDRSGLHQAETKQLEKIGNGGVSGRGIGKKSQEVVRYLSEHTDRHFLIIGAGGIMTAEDAAGMISQGADMIQIYKEQEEKIDWIHKCHEVELAQKESEVKKCEIRGCVKRIPPSEY